MMALCPDPKNLRSIEQAIIDLTTAVAQFTPRHPQALKLIEMINDLRDFGEASAGLVAARSLTE
jgi:hypothetical protein